MSAFEIRSRGYQAGIVLLYVATILFVIGVVSPMWLVYDRTVINIREETFYAGIVVGCQYYRKMVGAKHLEFTRCSFGFARAFDHMPSMGSWIHAVETFEIISALVLIFACIYAALFNCFIRYPRPRNRILEITSIAAGLTAFIFSMVFVGELREDVEKNVFYTFTWAFYLSVISSISVMVAGIIIALFNEYIPPPSDYQISNMMADKSMMSAGYSTQGSIIFDGRMSRAGDRSFDSFGARMSRAGSSHLAPQELYDPRISQVASQQDYPQDRPEPGITKPNGSTHVRSELESDL